MEPTCQSLSVFYAYVSGTPSFCHRRISRCIKEYIALRLLCHSQWTWSQLRCGLARKYQGSFRRPAVSYTKRFSTLMFWPYGERQKTWRLTCMHSMRAKVERTECRLFTPIQRILQVGRLPNTRTHFKANSSS